MTPLLLTVVLLAAPAPAEQGPALTVHDAVALALQQNPTAAAGRAETEAREAEAQAASAARLPTAALTAQAMGTNDPLNALGMKLQERNAAAADFAPDALNHPGIVGAVGLGGEAQVPLYAGGKLDASREAGAARAQASAAEQKYRRQQLAVQVVGAYFRAQLAEQGVRDAQDTLNDALGTERFAKARVQQDLMLKSDAARASAFRAQAESTLVSARQRLADARGDLALLVGEQARSATLNSAVDEAAAVIGGPSVRGDVEAARLDEQAARANVEVARSALRPSVAIQVRGGALWNGGSAVGAFATAGLGGRWDFLNPSQHGAARAAEAQASAAAEMRRWAEARAANELESARRGVESAHARVLAAREAVDAAVTSRDLRQARHREGLLPLTELLDAEVALTGARAALLDAQFAERFGRAQLALALGGSIEGVAP